MGGLFGFLEYAIACWSLHLHEFLVSQPEHKDVEELNEALEVFLGLHYQRDASKSAVTKTTKDQLSILGPSDSLEMLYQAVA